MPITNFVNKYSYKILVPTKWHKSYQISKWVPSKNIKIFPNVTNIIPTNNHEKVKMLNCKYNIWNKKVILYTGRLIKLKWVEYLLDAYYELIVDNNKFKEETVLIITWEWKEKLNLEEKSIKIQNIWWKVLFVGFIDNNELWLFYNMSHMWVVPSINIDGRSEAYGLVVNEYLIHWKPIITTNMVGASSIVKENSDFWYVVNEKSSSEVTIIMKKLLKESNEASGNRTENILKKIKKYNSYSECIRILDNITKK